MKLSVRLVSRFRVGGAQQVEMIRSARPGKRGVDEHVAGNSAARGSLRACEGRQQRTRSSVSDEQDRALNMGGVQCLGGLGDPRGAIRWPIADGNTDD
jgi:hypothetical protein